MAGKKGVIPCHVRIKSFNHPAADHPAIAILGSISDPRKPSCLRCMRGARPHHDGQAWTQKHNTNTIESAFGGYVEPGQTTSTRLGACTGFLWETAERERELLAHEAPSASEQRAACCIQRAYRKYKLGDVANFVPHPLDAHFSIQTIKRAPRPELHRGSYDALVHRTLQQAVYARSRESLRELANAIFAGVVTAAPLLRVNGTFTALQLEMYCSDASRPQIEDGAELISLLFDELKAGTAWPVTTATGPVEAEAGASWAKNCQVPPDQVVAISHGGGLSYIQDFLKGRVLGYRASRSEKVGLWVSPRLPELARTERDTAYATRTPLNHFDIPALFTARVEAKYLHGDIQNCGYEAVLLSGDRTALKRLHFKVLSPSFQNLSVPGMLNIKKALNGSPALYGRILAHIERLSALGEL